MRISIPSGYRLRIVDTDDIIMVKADDKAVKVVFEQGNAVKELRTWAYTVEEFARHAGLLQIHRATAINPEKIREVRSAIAFNCLDIYMDADVEPVSSSRRHTPAVRRAIKSLGHKQP